MAKTTPATKNPEKKDIITVRQTRQPTLLSSQFDEFEKKLIEIEKLEEGEEVPVDQNTEIALAFVANHRGRSSDTIAKALKIDKKLVSNYLSRARAAVRLMDEITKILPQEELSRYLIK